MSERTKAASLACAIAHSAVGQIRKYTGEPYYVHPYAVANNLQENYPEATEDMLIAACLHDVVEDTQVPISLIFEIFGATVADYVDGLTDVSTECKHLNRAARKAMDREHLATQCAEVQIIKCFDLIDNTKDIAEHDKDFARVYLKEKQLLVDAMTKVPDSIRKLTLEALEEAKKVVYGEAV